MSLSLYEAKRRLLSGEDLSWAKFGENKAGSVKLATPGARRLFQFLLTSDQAKVSDAHETLFRGLLEAWKLESFDPAAEQIADAATTKTGPWRLARLEAKGFGGLNLVDGPIFDVPFETLNWCLEGQNGSGKTSLVSAVIWALTGYRCRDQEGLFLDSGARTPVYDSLGVQIGDWPSIVAYPSTALKLGGVAETWVRLTFLDPTGNCAFAFRKLIAAPGSPPVIESTIN